MARKSRLADGSFRDLDWQAEEYRRLMGEEAAERQVTATGSCICKRRTIRTDQGYRTVHSRHCIKFRDWMDEFQPAATTSANAKAHARAAHRDD